ncbi:MAG: hypothetical protein HC861_02365 [Rhodospirillaceae bacterium]|nr:hypothetical protein [Rhodospirillaceae bacterium]
MVNQPTAMIKNTQLKLIRMSWAVTGTVAVATGVGVVRELNTDVREGAEDTAEAIVELLKPRMEAQGWL